MAFNEIGIHESMYRSVNPKTICFSTIAYNYRIEVSQARVMFNFEKQNAGHAVQLNWYVQDRSQCIVTAPSNLIICITICSCL